jgi:hypothetical protein
MSGLRRGWTRDAMSVAAALVVCASAGMLRYGLDVFRRNTAAFQLLTIGLAGSFACVGYRRGGWRGAALLAYLSLFVEYVLVGNLGHRESSPALIWVLIMGFFLVLAVIAFAAAARYIQFGRFVFVSLIAGAGFIAGTVVLGMILHLRPILDSARVNFAVGSLAGAALGLGLELSELISRKWVRGYPRGRS